jgi:hypothetical protein
MFTREIAHLKDAHNARFLLKSSMRLKRRVATGLLSTLLA